MWKRITAFITACIFMLLAIPVMSTEASSTDGWLWPVAESYRHLSRGYHSSHSGIDIDISSGSDVYASKAGTVLMVYTGCNSTSVASTKNSRTCSSSSCSPNCNYQSYTRYDDDGNVIKSYKACNYGYGNGVVIKHSDGTISMYAHMSTVSVSKNDTVSQGQKIGTSGSTGNSTGAHLHFSIGSSYTKNGNYISPKTINNNPNSPDFKIKSSNKSGLSTSNGYVYNTNGVGYIFNTVPVPGKPTLSCTPGDSLTETRFTWSSTANTSYYTLRIYDSGGSLYTMQGGISGTSYSYLLPAGSYTASLAAVNSTSGNWTFSSDISFTVKTSSAADPPSKPSFYVTAGSSMEEVAFSWSKTTNTSYYTIRIYDSTGELYLLRGGIPETSFYAILPAGKYTAKLASVNKPAENWTFSDTVSFTVSTVSTPSAGELVSQREENHKLFCLYEKAADWLAAEAIAAAGGGSLAAITSQEEQDAVAELVTEFGYPCWLGAEVFRNSSWRWTNGSSFSYSNWAELEPSGGYGKENCLQILPGGEWNDHRGTATTGTSAYNVKGYVVEYEPIGLSAFSMTDGIPEGMPVPHDAVTVLVTFSDQSLWITNDYEISVSGTSVGTQTATVTYGNLTAYTTVDYIERRVMNDPDFILPDDLTVIEERAFANDSMRIVRCPDGLEQIMENAFSDCKLLEEIYIPASVTYIANDIFSGCADGLTIFGYSGTEAESFAEMYGYTCIAVD